MGSLLPSKRPTGPAPPRRSVCITQVAFYYFDSSGNKVTLGTVTVNSAGAWTLTSPTTFGLPAGTYTIYAQAEDSYGTFGDPFAITLTVQ